MKKEKINVSDRRKVVSYLFNFAELKAKDIGYALNASVSVIHTDLRILEKENRLSKIKWFNNLSILRSFAEAKETEKRDHVTELTDQAITKILQINNLHIRLGASLNTLVTIFKETTNCGSLGPSLANNLFCDRLGCNLTRSFPYEKNSSMAKRLNSFILNKLREEGFMKSLVIDERIKDYMKLELTINIFHKRIIEEFAKEFITWHNKIIPLLSFWTDKLPERGLKVIKMFYEEEYSLEEIAKALNLTKERIRQQKEKSLRLIRKYLTEAGIKFPI